MVLRKNSYEDNKNLQYYTADIFPYPDWLCILSSLCYMANYRGILPLHISCFHEKKFNLKNHKTKIIQASNTQKSSPLVLLIHSHTSQTSYLIMILRWEYTSFLSVLFTLRAIVLKTHVSNSNPLLEKFYRDMWRSVVVLDYRIVDW